MQRQKDWMLRGTHWTACSVIMKFFNEQVTHDFSHNNSKTLQSWNNAKVFSWRRFEDMRDCFKRVCKITDVVWGKINHFRKQAPENVQLNNCTPDKVTTQTGHVNSSFFNACCTDENQNMLHASSGFYVKKESCIALR